MLKNSISAFFIKPYKAFLPLYKFLYLGFIASTTALVVISSLLSFRRLESLELRGGERHSSEKRAGVFVACGRGTLLIGYAVITCGYEKLCISYKSYYREDTERYIKTVAAGVDHDILADSLLYLARNIRAFDTRNTAGAIYDLSAKNYGRNHLYYRGGVGIYCYCAHITIACVGI